MTEAALSRGRNALSKPVTKRPYSYPTITRDIITRRAAALDRANSNGQKH
jgi:hypothetical protein